jgi:hypothetical protein
MAGESGSSPSLRSAAWGEPNKIAAAALLPVLDESSLCPKGNDLVVDGGPRLSRVCSPPLWHEAPPPTSGSGAVFAVRTVRPIRGFQKRRNDEQTLQELPVIPWQLRSIKPRLRLMRKRRAASRTIGPSERFRQAASGVGRAVCRRAESPGRLRPARIEAGSR